ncbi:MAG: SDR family NAD(P)-dependent oxidoreductase [Deltaproteobacteria bacterium]|nr:SDR family NAD(P)-dependent oxidoreductase [Deltaproteobacteria bacterium]
MSTTFGATSTAEEVTEGLDLTGTTWLVTGCNSGLGNETVRVLALRGGRIIGLARTKEKADHALSALGADGVGVACDLEDLASVRAAVTTVSGLGPLDGIIANAGIMALPKLEQVHGIERQLFTNHVGHFVLVTGLVDQLTPTGRVVMLSSGAHHYAERGMELDNLSGETDYAPWRAYGRSKLANILFARSLAHRFGTTGRTANSVHPGVIETNLGRHVEDREGMYDRLRHLLKSIGAGAATQVYVATHPSLAEVNGVYFSDCTPTETRAEGRDDDLAAALWTATEELVQGI